MIALNAPPRIDPVAGRLGQGSMSQQVIRDVVIGSVVTCSMVALIVLGASRLD